ncbi:MAG TPA: nuclear transport factor 2 family protein [Thermoanaerobaculia bacterium]|nr:nuclear transport factor 2 family protein [Thermoanaerobaculia bacterium]
MKRMMCLLSVLVIAAFFARPAIADRDEVDDLLERYLAAYNNGDAAALAELYSADAVLLPHDQASVRGRSKIEQFWKRTLRFDPARRMGRSVSTLLMAKKAGADVAYLVGTFGIGSGEIRNFTICLVRDSEGKWRVASEMWNSNGPRFQPAV